MLNVGEPVNVLELAERMIRLSGRVVGDEIAIEFIGARPGEKLSEQLQDIDEEAHPTNHPAITRLVPDRRRRRSLWTARSTSSACSAARGQDDEVRQLLDELTFTDVEPAVAARRR